MSDDTALSCARALLVNWLPRFGIPTEITSDRGRQFRSVLWTALSKLLGTQLHHPQANGLVERVHRQRKGSFKLRLHGQDWRGELPFVLLGIRSTIKEDLVCTSAELVCRMVLRLPGELFETTARTTDMIADARDLLPLLRASMHQLRAKPMTQH